MMAELLSDGTGDVCVPAGFTSWRCLTHVNSIDVISTPTTTPDCRRGSGSCTMRSLCASSASICQTVGVPSTGEGGGSRMCVLWDVIVLCVCP